MESTNVSEVTQKETDTEWQEHRLLKKSVPRFAKKHGGAPFGCLNRIDRELYNLEAMVGMTEQPLCVR